jgi:hypothetical protein
MPHRFLLSGVMAISSDIAPDHGRARVPLMREGEALS